MTPKPISFRLNFFYPVTLVLSLVTTCKTAAQPYIDVANLRYNGSPDAGVVNRNKNLVSLQYLNIGTNLPLQFRNKRDALVFSPYYEKWWVNGNRKEDYTGIALPVSLIKSIGNTKWGFLLNGIVRLNDSSISKKTNMQVGGALIVTYKSRETLTWKLGVYINNELFGVFVMPLAGIDWQINTKNNLFGILPGNLTYEHRVNKWLYYGAMFRAITNSYGKQAGYWRVDENQLGLYLDTYLSKNLVFNVEAGHSLWRKLRTGIKNTTSYDKKVNDNIYFKISLAYRVRFAKR